MERGWYNDRPGSNPKFESYRHRLARYGIKTTKQVGDERVPLSDEEIKRRHDMLMNKLNKEKKSFLAEEDEDKTEAFKYAITYTDPSDKGGMQTKTWKFKTKDEAEDMKADLEMFFRTKGIKIRKLD